MMVFASDLNRDPGFQLSQRENGAALRVIVLLELDVAERRARQDMNSSHHCADETRYWPRQINPTFAQPSCFVVDGVKKTQAHRNAGRRFKGEVKSCDHSSADVDRDRQHSPPNWAPILLVDDDNIDNRVVDLPYRVGTVRDKLAWAWGRRRLQSPLPSSAGRRQRI